MKRPSKPASVDEFLGALPADARAALKQLSAFIKDIVPDSSERISYGVVIVKTTRDLVGYSAQKDFCSFYTMSPALTKAITNDLKKFKVSGATIHFQPDKPLPKTLLRKIIRARLAEQRS